jgi:hypothetical protein
VLAHRPPFGTPAPLAAIEHVSVMKHASEESGGGCGVAEQLAPVLDGAMRHQDGGGRFVPPHNEFEQILRGDVREWRHAESAMSRSGTAASAEM